MRIVRISLEGDAEDFEDTLILEHRIKISIDGGDMLSVTLSPGKIEEMVIGMLITRGFISSIDEISSIHIENEYVDVSLSIANRETSSPSHLSLETSGFMGAFQSVPKKKVETCSVFMPAVILEGIKKLSDTPLFKSTGCAHVAALFGEKGEPVSIAEDVGRHNAVDKAIGGGLIEGAQFSQCWLAVSGRLPSDMVIKCAMAGIPLIASVSAATLQGADAGEKWGITVVGFARGNKFNCYSHPERIACGIR